VLRVTSRAILSIILGTVVRAFLRATNRVATRVGIAPDGALRVDRQWQPIGSAAQISDGEAEEKTGPQPWMPDSFIPASPLGAHLRRKRQSETVHFDTPVQIFYGCAVRLQGAGEQEQRIEECVHNRTVLCFHDD